MRPFVKICGITNLADALFAARAGADALGFIFYRQSPRFVEPSVAASVIDELPGYVTPVGVFVNERRASIERTVAETGVRIAQLSGDEPAEECQGLSVKVWKAFRIRDREAIVHVKRYDIAAAVLEGAGAEEYGGSGVLPDLAIACEMKQYHPLVLAGGLTPDNVIGAVRAVDPFGIDVNSALESTPGQKDHEKITQLFERLNRLG